MFKSDLIIKRNINEDNSWVSDLAPLVPLTELQLDELFIAASKL